MGEEMKGVMCENAKELAQRLHKALETKHKRPFNRFDIEKSMWWIIPSTVYQAGIMSRKWPR
jgi:hypothetical protein